MGLLKKKVIDGDKIVKSEISGGEVKFISSELSS